MAKLHYYLRDINATGETAVYLLIRTNGRRLKYYTGQSIEPRFWNQKDERAVKMESAPEWNSILTDKMALSEKAVNRLTSELRTEPSPEELRDELDRVFDKSRKTDIPKTLFGFFTWYIEDFPNRENKRTNEKLAKTTERAIKQTNRILLEYKKAKNQRIDFDTIDMAFYRKFVKYMEERMYTKNTIGKHICNLKTVLKAATKKGINTNFIYQEDDFAILQEPVDNIYLSESELQELLKLDLTKKPRLKRVRDMFVIGCWTGLRFSDFTRLNSARIVNDDDGYPCFEILTQKTKSTVLIPILPQIESIIQEYGGLQNLTLPERISNQKLNQYVKEMAALSPALCVDNRQERTKGGVKVSVNKKKYECITTHTCRRSFCTNMYKRRIPVELIMAISGHKTESQFYQYIKEEPKGKATRFRHGFIGSSPLSKAQ
jgi:integrase